MDLLKIVRKLRNRQYEIKYTYKTEQGKERTVTLPRDASMLIPEKQRALITEDYDPMISSEPVKPAKHDR